MRAKAEQSSAAQLTIATPQLEALCSDLPICSSDIAHCVYREAVTYIELATIQRSIVNWRFRGFSAH
jgi:hypothetical protein